MRVQKLPFMNSEETMCTGALTSHSFETTLVKLPNKLRISFRLTCLVLSWLSSGKNDLKFRKKDGKL